MLWLPLCLGDALQPVGLDFWLLHLVDAPLAVLWHQHWLEVTTRCTVQTAWAKGVENLDEPHLPFV